MTDQELQQRIAEMADEEHALLERHGSGDGLSEDEHARLGRLEVEQDQAWDHLRRRRAAKRAGRNPDEVQPRDIGTVEGYQQ